MSNSPSARHILVVEDQKGRRTIPLEETTYSMGRHSSNSIAIHSRHASRKHATLLRRINSKTNTYSFWILDGDLDGNRSNNGIFVNGEKCLVHELKHGDLVNFGCNVNASYHILSNVSDATFTRDYVKTSYRETPVSPTYSNQSTLIISESHIDQLNNDRTIQEQNFRDNLTGLPNCTLFNEHLYIALTNARRNEKLTAVIFLDIDRFKQINETLGQTIGDQVLKVFAQRLNHCVRSGDIVARWGGDEFTILFPNINLAEDVERIMERIIKSLKQPFDIANHQLYLNSSYGVAIYPQDGEDAQTLVKRAENNLYAQQAKPQTSSRGTKAGSQATMAQPTLLAKVEKLIAQALRQNELRLYYQPQININTGSIYGMEALLRWHHPELGSVSPSKLLPWAEQTDMIIPIGEWVLRTACLQNQAWRKLGLPPHPIAVNLSARQFQNPDLVNMVAKVLAETGLDPRLLELEITEATLLQDLEFSRTALQQLQAMGVNISLDDFGTGYSSLVYLNQLPLDSLKIAQTCVGQLKENPENTAMISATIALGRAFNLRVVAEGVETSAQLELLRSLHCEQMQGFRFSRPLKVEDATRFLSAQRTIAA